MRKSYQHKSNLISTKHKFIDTKLKFKTTKNNHPPFKHPISHHFSFNSINSPSQLYALKSAEKKLKSNDNPDSVTKESST